MSLKSITDLAVEQKWTEPLEQGIQTGVAELYAAAGEPGRQVQNVMHGVWLGHPLHPVLTDVPIGAWTVAVVLDATDAIGGTVTNSRAADAAIGIGLVGAAGAALTGLTDWHKTDGKARRIGMMHGLLNIGATALFTTSWLLRRGKKRETARVCSLAGYIVAAASAYLGGVLVYDQKIGVDHAQREGTPDQFVPVLAEAELPEGKLVRVEARGIKVLVVRQNGRIYAIGETCAHLGGPLAEGSLEGDSVRCPWHGSCFALDDGRVLEGPSAYPQPCFEARVRDGHIEVRSAHAPEAIERLTEK